MTDTGAAWQIGYTERVMCTIEGAKVNFFEHRDCRDAYQQIGRLLEDVYMHRRIHSALGCLTPDVFGEWTQPLVPTDSQD